MEENQSLFSLTIDPELKSNLLETARWTRILSIGGMILSGLIFIILILKATILTAIPGQMSLGYEQQMEFTNSVRVGTFIGAIIFIAITFIPLNYLLSFSNKIKRALVGNEQDYLNYAFSNLKRYFRFIGIILIILLFIYGILFIVTILPVLIHH